MEEVFQNIPPQPSHVIAILARQAAVKAVKERLRRQGVKPAYMPKRDIVAPAEDYLVEHRHDLLTRRPGSACALRRNCESYMIVSKAGASACLNEYQQICTARGALIFKQFSLCKCHPQNGRDWGVYL